MLLCMFFMRNRFVWHQHVQRPKIQGNLLPKDLKSKGYMFFAIESKYVRSMRVKLSRIKNAIVKKVQS